MSVYVRGILKGIDKEIISLYSSDVEIKDIFSLYVSIKSTGFFFTERYPDGSVQVEVSKLDNSPGYEPIYEDSRDILNIIDTRF